MSIEQERGDRVTDVPAGVPEDQRWFWTPEWQAGEREASEELARGEVTFFADADELFAYLTGPIEE
ncbi:hypothetical protein F0L68_06395 [Solihabitans fulvus]|uniref:Uncharacterized protein n=1 Tax=Solihabitans fulvus TaxID=1892852 RepID=A0A5B2XLQ4_9PSEU|nr:hypothetical protein [Solihabitans fulvus]KAA2264717.1 hypothetical protein F0L68_06395 [Solihabitans fulvus]